MKTMSELYDSIRLTRSAATFTRALGIDAPDGADAPCDIVLDKLFAELAKAEQTECLYITPTLSHCGCFRNILNCSKMRYSEHRFSSQCSPLCRA